MKKRDFIEGAFIATVAIFFSKFIGIIYAIPFKHIIGDQGGALYGYAYNIYNLFLVISCAGIPLAISKLTSEYNALNKIEEKEYMFYAAKRIIAIFSVLAFLVCFLGAPFIAKVIIGNITGGNTTGDVTFVIRCVSFAILVVPLLSINRGYLQGHGYIGPASLSQVIEQILRVAVVLGGSYWTLNVLHLSLKNAVGVAVFGACVGAIAAYVYLVDKTLKIKKKNTSYDNINKENRTIIIKKIILYSLPFIVTNIANSLYNTTDMILLRYGLHNVGYATTKIETVSSIFTTWGSKLNTIITSIATGIAISLVPSVAKSNAKGDLKDINDKFNKTLQIFLYVALPLAIFMSIFATQIWTIFYGPSELGPIVFKFSIITAAVDALYIMMCNGLQGLNKTKLIFASVGLGLLINLCLDIPLIYLFNNLGIYPFYGAITATIIGYSISLIIPLVTLKRKYNLNYKNTIDKLPKLLLVYALMIFLSLLYRGIITMIDSKLLLLLLIAIIGIILLVIYYYLNKKEIEEIFGLKIKKLLRKKRDINE